MSRFPNRKIITGLVWIGIHMACTLQPGQVTTPGIETSLASSSTTPAGTATLPPTEPLPSLTPTPAYAPICNAQATSIPTPAACQLPIAEQSSVFCTNKVPYTLILMNANSTYQVLSEGFSCTDAGMRDDKELVTCTGVMASAFQLQVCDPACAIPTVQSEITQCPPDYSFDNLQGCCTQGPLSSGQNCTVFEFATTSCVVDCSVFTDEGDCDENSIACEWDDSNSVCRLRR